MTRWGPPALWAAAIVAGSFLPSRNIPGPAMGQDFWIHVFMYAVLTTLVYRWHSDIRFVTLVCVAFASVQEPLQGLSPTREASVDDWLFNLVGVAAALVVILALMRRPRRLH